MISKSSLQSIKAFVVLADLKVGETKDVVSIAKKIGFPDNYLAKVLQRLVHARLLISQKGANGGFRLAKTPADIRLYDVVNALEDVDLWEGCFMGQLKCSKDNACAAHDRWAIARNAYIDFLKGTTIADLNKK